MAIRNRGSIGLVETPKETKKRKKTNRRLLFIGGAVIAVGIGTYLGSKKSMSQIVKSLENSEKHLAKLVEHTYFQEALRQDNLLAIDTAMNNNIPFTHFPGVGVHSFETSKIFELSKPAVKKALTKVKKK